MQVSHVRVHAAVLKEGTLSALARCLWAAILFKENQGQEAYLSYFQFQDWFGAGRLAIKKALAELCAAGKVTAHKRSVPNGSLYAAGSACRYEAAHDGLNGRHEFPIVILFDPRLRPDEKLLLAIIWNAQEKGISAKQLRVAAEKVEIKKSRFYKLMPKKPGTSGHSLAERGLIVCSETGYLKIEPIKTNWRGLGDAKKPGTLARTTLKKNRMQRAAQTLLLSLRVEDLLSENPRCGYNPLMDAEFTPGLQDALYSLSAQRKPPKAGAKGGRPRKSQSVAA